MALALGPPRGPPGGTYISWSTRTVVEWGPSCRSSSFCPSCPPSLPSAMIGVRFLSRRGLSHCLLRPLDCAIYPWQDLFHHRDESSPCHQLRLKQWKHISRIHLQLQSSGLHRLLLVQNSFMLVKNMVASGHVMTIESSTKLL